MRADDVCRAKSSCFICELNRIAWGRISRSRFAIRPLLFRITRHSDTDRAFLRCHTIVISPMMVASADMSSPGLFVQLWAVARNV
jgi:hypothetical protein